jgi:uncharacterized UBP type Zn finger protein
MGFDRALSERALKRTNNDVSHAVDLISSGKVDEEGDNEFDLLAAGNPEPEVHAPTVYEEIDHSAPQHPGGQDPFAQNTSDPNCVSELVDSRISMFTEMGFTAEQAENALKECNNDVNEALSMLSGSA